MRMQIICLSASMPCVEYSLPVRKQELPALTTTPTMKKVIYKSRFTSLPQKVIVANVVTFLWNLLVKL